ncbi:MAG TPA: hypothetical protein VF116_12015 [Ktedonobacterales bacterium]
MEKQRRRSRHYVLAFGCALVILLAGCGVTTGGSADTSGTSSTTANPATATASASASAATATATASGATSGAVTLSVGAGQYSASDRVVVTIRNGGDTSIFVQQHNTSCSLILLERLVNGAWQQVYPCNDGFPHPTVGEVAAGSAKVVQLVPLVSGNAEATGSQWQAGTYRAALSYVTSQTTSFSQGTVVYSSTFAVA